jgi:hypothetical protein
MTRTTQDMSSTRRRSFPRRRNDTATTSGTEPRYLRGLRHDLGLLRLRLDTSLGPPLLRLDTSLGPLRLRLDTSLGPTTA